MVLGHNWLTDGWRPAHGQMSGSIEDEGTNLTGDNPGFVSIEPVALPTSEERAGPADPTVERDLRLRPDSPGAGSAGPLPETRSPHHAVTREYVPHRMSRNRDETPASMGALGHSNP
jgi:hypothetical protein